MHIKKIFGKALTFLTIPVLLAGCGGGGGGGAADAVAAFNMAITVDLANLLSNEGEVTFEPGSQFATGFSVRLSRNDGSAVTATVVNISVSPATLGGLSTVGAPNTQSDSLQLTTSAGVVNGLFHTRDLTGTVQLTASAFDSAAGTNVTRTAMITIDQGPEPIQRITIESTRSTLPANRFNFPILLPGSPYIATVTLRFRNQNGVLTSPNLAQLGVSISPVTLAAFSTLDDPETTDINETLVLVGNAPVDTAGGEGTIFVHASDTPGTVRLSVTGQDPDTLESFDAEFEIEIVEPASDGLPANVGIEISPGPQYIQGSGGITAKPFGITVLDGAGVLVPDPTGGNNNVVLEVLTESPASGEVLRGVASNGTNVSGRNIAVATTNGISAASLLSGTEPGQVRIRATVDVSDNNVSNGVQVPLSAESSVVIGDGIPFSVTLTSIPINTLTVNPVVGTTIVTDPDPTDGIPPDPNATYSLRVGAQVTDRFGNPPAQPVELQWGLIDSPLDDFPGAGSGTFSLSGFDGDPDEGGTSFFAPTGEFTFAGGGAGPNDTLIIFGKDVVGNDDLESARTVDQINDRFNLIVDEPFNFNDFTGASVDYGPALPYIIGRALVGNIETGSVTDSNGAGATFMNYPASNLGRTTAIYVQGTNGNLPGSGAIATFADAAIIRYPGLAPLSIVASPNLLPANVQTNVQVCVRDAANVPLVGQFVVFAFTGGTTAVTSVDGIPNTGLVANPTGFDGCTVALVDTSGVAPGGGDGDLNLVFSVGDASDTVEISIPTAAILQAIPSAIFGNTLATTIVLRYTDAAGQPVANIGLTGSCTNESGVVSIINPPGATDANGETTVTIAADVDALICPDDSVASTSPRDTPAMETCTFTTATGMPMVEVSVNGTNVLIASFSPMTPGCPP